MPDPQAPHALLPFEIACQGTLDRSIIDPSKLPRDRIAEVSRLAVMSGFRRRKGEKLSAGVSIGDQDFGGVETPRFPNIPLSLYIAAVLMAQRQGIEYLFVLTEPRLSKHFSKLGVNIVPIGEPIDFRGTRVPSVMRVPDIYPGLRNLVRPIWHAIDQQLTQACKPTPVVAAPRATVVEDERELETC
jgi:N-acyl amino acid synthase of PEP-CTERM/exosortase system